MIFFEVNLPTRGTYHMHIQVAPFIECNNCLFSWYCKALPVPSSLLDKLKDAFLEEANKIGFNFDEFDTKVHGVLLHFLLFSAEISLEYTFYKELCHGRDTWSISISLPQGTIRRIHSISICKVNSHINILSWHSMNE